MSNTPSVSVLVLVIWYMLTLVICSLNNKVNLIPHPVPVTPSTALDLLRPYSIILDCTDRPLTRYLLSDAAVRLDVPLFPEPPFRRPANGLFMEARRSPENVELVTDVYGLASCRGV